MKRYILLIMVLLFAAAPTVPAQLRHRKVPKFNFEHFELNRIQFAERPNEGFGRFCARLDSVILYGMGNLSIVHIGGSHVQGGTWTQQLRRDLMLVRYGLDGGRGFVFPYAAAGTNTPSGYSSSSTGVWTASKCTQGSSSTRLGLSGMAVTTSDTSATVTIALQERSAREWSPSFTFNTVDVLGYGTMEPVILMDRDTVRGIPVPEQGLYAFRLPHYTEEVTVGLSGEGWFTLTGLYLDNPFSGITVSEIGVNGAATGSYLKCVDFTRDLTLLHPDLVIFSISINDIQGNRFHKETFIDNYASLIREVREASPGCAIVLTTNNDSFRHGRPNPLGEDARQAFKYLAVKYGTGLWDLYEIMGGTGSMAYWETMELARLDKIHFTPEGYDILGNLLFNALMDTYRGR